MSIFELADANGQRGTMTARQILDDAEKDIPQEFADQPELREKLLKKIGTVYDKITAAAPLAMILEASGAVQLQSTRDPNRRAVPQTLLYTGDRLSLADDAQAPTRRPVRPAQGTAPTGHGGDDPPQRL